MHLRYVAALLPCCLLLALPEARAEDWTLRLAEEMDLTYEIENSPALRWKKAQASCVRFLRAESFAELDELLSALTGYTVWTEKDQQQVPQLFDLLAQLCHQRPPLIAHWIKARPDSAHAHLVRSKVHVKTGYAARGGGYAHQVSPEGWKVWHAEIPKAKAAVEQALALRPDHPVALGQRLRVDRCGSASPEDFQTHLAQARERTPNNHQVHQEAITYLLPRWHGSWTQIWELIADLEQKSPGHPVVLETRVEAHIIRANELARGARDRKRAIQGYVQQPKVKAELAQAFQRTRERFAASMVPARIQLSLGSQLGFYTPEETDGFAYELANKHDPTWMINVAMHLVRNPEASPGPNREKFIDHSLLLGTLLGEEKVKGALLQRLIGAQANKPARPKAAYLLCRVLGQQGSRHFRGLAIEYLRNGVGVTQDEAGAVAEHLAQAEAGNESCAFHYGMIRWAGSSGTKVDRELALEWTLKAAEAGQPQAVRFMCEVDLGLRERPKDLERAARWVRLAESKRFPDADQLRRLYRQAAGE